MLALRGPGPLPRARSGRGKRWQARHTRRLCWQARHLGALGRCRARARAAGNAGGRAGAMHASFVLAGAALRGPGPLPRACSGRGKRWQARRTCRLCWQARHLLGALGRCRARARAAGNAGRRDTRVVCAGRRGAYCRARARAAGNAGRRDTRVVCAAAMRNVCATSRKSLRLCLLLDYACTSCTLQMRLRLGFTCMLSM